MELGIARPRLYVGSMHPVSDPDPPQGPSLARPGASGAAARVVCIGGATVDRSYKAFAPMRRGTSNPVAGRRSFGGVAHNVAATLTLLGVATSLVSIVGEDENGQGLIAHLKALGIECGGIARSSRHATAEYIAVLDPDRSLAFGAADMAIFDEFTLSDLDRLWPRCAEADWLFADCNLPPEILAALLRQRPQGRLQRALDVVSTAKALRLPQDLTGIDLLFLNLDEAQGLAGAPSDAAETAIEILLARGARQILLTRGAEGLVLGDATGIITALPAVAADVTDVTGAGDAMIAATLWALLGGARLDQAARFGSLAAALTIEHDGSVDPAMSVRRLLARARQSGLSDLCAPPPGVLP